MNKRISDKEIIDKFVNSYEFPVIDNYISKPYEETIIELDNEIKEQGKEIERLNNVINELEKWLKEENKFDEYKDITYRETMGCVLDELKELKEGDKDEI